ncbi:hypothetical protein METH_05400 [Leisingera methylohalidivorans DSM 14336]|uniref:Uncharacterized protein n=1 Tax=Leisingera methylohalidivorans DSM 14336 TaxID=999552 RepID=V9W161_9RHOB|nr:hypothetical protein METH_05400 [Leisingera methylohalidivorans DSM 14336]
MLKSAPLGARFSFARRTFRQVNPPQADVARGQGADGSGTAPMDGAA